MRSWLFHPVIFYPLAAILAAGAILISLQPQAWPRPPAAVEGRTDQGVVVLDGEALGAPTGDRAQSYRVVRDFLGRGEALRIAQLPGQPPPAGSDAGVQIAFAPTLAAALANRPVQVEVTYRPLPVNAASALAVRMTGESQGLWVTRTTPPQAARVRFELPAQASIDGLGLRAISSGTDQSYGLEIIRIRIRPLAAD